MIEARLRPSRRTVVAGLASVLGTAACGRGGETLAQTIARRGTVPMEPRRVLPLSHFGVDRFAARDQRKLLAAAFEAAEAERYNLFADPDATYRYDGPLMLNSVSFDGQGCTLMPLSDGPQVLRCLGTRWRLANLRLLGGARIRNADPGFIGVLVGDGDERPAANFAIENVAVGAVEPGRGVGGAGFLFDNASRGRIVRAVVRDSLADGIHVTNGSHNLTFERPISESTGDDGFAIVSYRRQGSVCRDIRVLDGISRDSMARGFSVVGGKNVTYAKPLIERSSAAGVYFYGEDSYDTYGVERCSAVAPVLHGCVTGRGKNPGFSNAAIIIGGREGSDVVGGAKLLRGAADCTVTSPVVKGAGAACWAGISTHEHAIRPKVIDARLSDLIPERGSFRPNGVEIGGKDVVIDNIRIDNISGISIVVTKTASGSCRVEHPIVTRALMGAGPISSFIYSDAAPNLKQAVIRNGIFSAGPKRLALGKLGMGGVVLQGNQMQ